MIRAAMIAPKAAHAVKSSTSIKEILETPPASTESRILVLAAVARYCLAVLRVGP